MGHLEKIFLSKKLLQKMEISMEEMQKEIFQKVERILKGALQKMERMALKNPQKTEKILNGVL